MCKPLTGIGCRLLLLSALTTAFLLSMSGPAVAADTATIIISTSTGNDTLVRGISGAITVTIDPGVDSVAGGELWLTWFFTNGNIAGPMLLPDNPVFSETAISVFEGRGIMFGEADDPDSMLVGFYDLDGALPWLGVGELFRFVFSPTDTGLITIDPEVLSRVPTHSSQITPWGGSDFDLKYQIPTITVADCEDASITNGDALFDRSVNSADIIYLVNHVFKGGPEPVLWNLGDANCDGKITSADIVSLVNYIFKSGAAPCDVCSRL